LREIDETNGSARLVVLPEAAVLRRGGLAQALCLGGGWWRITLWTGFVETAKPQAEHGSCASRREKFAHDAFSSAVHFGKRMGVIAKAAMEIMAMATLGFVVMWLVRRVSARATNIRRPLGRAALCSVRAFPLPPPLQDTEHGKPELHRLGRLGQ